MKITSNPFHQVAPRNNASVTSEQGSQTAQGSRSQAAAVELSPAARELAALDSEQNDIDMAKVQAIRTALADGSLKIDASRIADGLISSAKDLLK